MHRINYPAILRLLEKCLQEGPSERIDYLYNKYASSLATRMVEAGVVGTGNGLDGNNAALLRAKAVISSVVEYIDPKHGAYSEWIVTRLMALSNNELSRTISYWDEDMPKVTQELALFDRFRPKLKSMDGTLTFGPVTLANHPKEIPVRTITDIRHLPTFLSLSRLVRGYLQPLLQAKEDEKLGPDEVEKIWDSPPWLVVSPKTERASCKYGAETRWCTAATYNNYFNQYNKQGPLYIFINRAENTKWQFHFQSNQFMDEDDSSIDVEEFSNAHPEVKPVLFSLAKKEGHTQMLFLIDEDAALSHVQSLPDEAAARAVKDSLLACLAWGFRDPDRINSLQKVLVFPPVGNKKAPVVFNTFSDITDLTGVLDFRKTSEKYVDQVLEHNIDPDGVELMEGDVADVLTWIDRQHFPAFQEFVLKSVEAHNLDPWTIPVCTTATEIWAILTDTEDDVYGPVVEAVRELLDQTYNRASRTAESDASYNAVLDAIGAAFGTDKSGLHWGDKDHVSIDVRREILDDLTTAATRASDEPLCLDNLFDTFAAALEADGELERIDFSDARGYLSRREHAGLFNEYLSDEMNS